MKSEIVNLLRTLATMLFIIIIAITLKDKHQYQWEIIEFLIISFSWLILSYLIEIKEILKNKQ